MRARLREDPVSEVQSADRALWLLGRIQTHRVVLGGQAPITGISAMDAQQLAVLTSLKIKKPAADAAYVNL